MKKRILFIVNPISGTKRKRNVLELVEKHIDREQYDCSIRTTAYAGHAAEIAAGAAADGVEVVVAIGGDGTVNEVARSIVHTSTALAIIPCGSGNGLARHLHIPINARRAIDIINRHVVHTLDYGKINGRPFFCTCGMGFDAFISEKFAQGKQRGSIGYAQNMLVDGLGYKPDTYTIITDDEQENKKAFLIACANASQYGNNALIAPHASMKDGMMDVTIMEPINVLEAPVVALQLFTGGIGMNPRVKTFRTDHLVVEREHSGFVHCDGEPFETGRRIEVELIPQGLNVLVNHRVRKRQESPAQYFSAYLANWNRLSREFFKRGEEFRKFAEGLGEKLKIKN